MRRLVLLLAGLLFVSVRSVIAQSPEPAGLFLPVTDANQRVAAEQTLVRLNPQVSPTADDIYLNFAGQWWQAQKSYTKPHDLIPGGTVWVGHIAQHPEHLVVLTFGGGQFAGSFATFNGRYAVRPLDPTDRTLHVVEPTTDDPDDHEPGMYPADLYTDMRAVFDPQANNVDYIPDWQTEFYDQLDPGNSTIDLLVTYTPAALQNWGGTETAALNAIATGNALTNEAIQRSNTPETRAIMPQFRVVHAYQNAFTNDAQYSRVENGEFLKNPNDGIYDDVYPLQDEYAADMIVLYNMNTDAGATGGGIAIRDWPGGGATPRQARHWTVTGAGGAFNLTIPHELGHLLALSHDVANVTGSPGVYNGLYDFSFGYRIPGSFRTIMAYRCVDDGLAACPPIDYFSNLTYEFNGQLMGAEREDGVTAMNHFATRAQFFRNCRAGGRYDVAGTTQNDLIEAILLANGDRCNDTVTVHLQPNATYDLTYAFHRDGDLRFALPQIASDRVIIEGNGATLRRVGNEPFGFIRGYWDEETNLTIRNLTFENGLVNDGEGGAIYSRGALTLINTTFINNQAGLNGGAISQYTNGPVMIRNSTFTGNTSGGSGGAIFVREADLTIENSTFDQNTATNGGGAVDTYLVGDLRIADTTFSANRTDSGVGGALNLSESTSTLQNLTFTANEANWGGAIHSVGAAGTTHIEDSVFQQNRTLERDGGAILHRDGDLLVERSLFQDSSADWGGAMAIVRATATIRDTSFDNSRSVRDGGALNVGESTLMLEQVSFTNNQGSWGGALRVFESEATITNTTFSNSVATGPGGAIHGRASNLTLHNVAFIDNQSAANGGAVHLDGVQATIAQTLFQGNRSERRGGAIHHFTPLEAPNTLLLYNSTVTQNEAEAGSAVSVENGTGRVAFTTFATNTDTADWGSALYNLNGTIEVLASLIVDSAAPNCGDAITSLGYNISDDASCGFNATGDAENTDPRLRALADNGGFTQTMALQAGSPALNSVPVAACQIMGHDNTPITINTDQRGYLRPSDGACESGAFEFAASIPQDVNRDGTVTLRDAIYLVNRQGSDDLSMDLSGDGSITQDDVALLLQYIEDLQVADD